MRTRYRRGLGTQRGYVLLLIKSLCVCVLFLSTVLYKGVANQFLLSDDVKFCFCCFVFSKMKNVANEWSETYLNVLRLRWNFVHEPKTCVFLCNRFESVFAFISFCSLFLLSCWWWWCRFNIFKTNRRARRRRRSQRDVSFKRHGDTRRQTDRQSERERTWQHPLY